MLRPRPHHARLPRRTSPRQHHARLPLHTSPRLGRLPLPTLPHRMLPRRQRSRTAEVPRMPRLRRGPPRTPQQRERLRKPRQDAPRPRLALPSGSLPGHRLLHPRPAHGTRRARAPPRRSKRTVPAPPPAAKRDRSWPNPAQARKRSRPSRLGATIWRAQLRAQVPPRASAVRKTRRRKISRTEPSKRQVAIAGREALRNQVFASRSGAHDPSARALARSTFQGHFFNPNGGFVRRAPS
jgi:hypothetical protein